MSKRIVIVGGVAGGMSCAARLKRLDDSLEVTVFEKGNDVSFANCGMPYHIGGEIAQRGALLLHTPASLKARYGLDIRTSHEVVSIDRAAKQVQVKNLVTGELSTCPYDTLVLSPGAAPLRPPLPGVDRPNVFVLNDLADMDGILSATVDAKRVTVVGAGFIGLELVENFRARGLAVTLVEMLDQVLPPLDREMARPLADQLRLNGVDVRLGETLSAIEDGRIVLKSGKTIETDFTCLCIGVKPSTGFCVNTGIELGPRGHIITDATMRTNDPTIYAVGDAVQVKDFTTGADTAVPLAGPANRQGRIAADNICGIQSTYRDTQGTAIVKVFNLAAAMTGMSEKSLKRAGIVYRHVHVHPMQRPRYYPGAQPVSLKLLFSPEGKILGAQAVGADGVDSIINVLATAQRAGLTVEDLEHMELAYSPQWGGAKHPINMAGFVASNILKGHVDTFESDDDLSDAFILDVRAKGETEAGMLPNATIIPVDELRSRYNELPRNKEIAVYCAVGLRGYIACRFLAQKGFRVRNLNGGYRTWSWFQEKETTMTQDIPTRCSKKEAPEIHPDLTLDVRGLQCPGPIVKVKQTVQTMKPGQEVDILASDPGFAADIPMWCKRTGNTLIEVKPDGQNYRARVRREGERTCELVNEGTKRNSKTIICFSNDLDKVLATFIIANGAAAMQSDVTIFFTFWGLNVLRKKNSPGVKKGLLDRMFGAMMPKGAQKLALSKMHMGGMGTAMMKYVMRSKNVMSLPTLIKQAQDSGVRLVACAMSMDIMGIKQEELIDGIEIAGVGHYLGTADEAGVNLFI